jgi:hypothetical protein
MQSFAEHNYLDQTACERSAPCKPTLRTRVPEAIEAALVARAASRSWTSPRRPVRVRVPWPWTALSLPAHGRRIRSPTASANASLQPSSTSSIGSPSVGSALRSWRRRRRHVCRRPQSPTAASTSLVRRQNADADVSRQPGAGPGEARWGVSGFLCVRRVNVAALVFCPPNKR